MLDNLLAGTRLTVTPLAGTSFKGDDTSCPSFGSREGVDRKPSEQLPFPYSVRQ